MDDSADAKIIDNVGAKMSTRSYEHCTRTLWLSRNSKILIIDQQCRGYNTANDNIHERMNAWVNKVIGGSLAAAFHRYTTRFGY